YTGRGFFYPPLVSMCDGVSKIDVPREMHDEDAILEDMCKDSTLYDREVAESLQNELDGMQLPDVRWRIQTAMPFVFPSVKLSISCQPPNVPVFALGFLQPSISIPGPHHATKPLSSQPDFDIEIDPWTVLEDGAGSGPSFINAAEITGSDHTNMKALSWLKGAVRVRRMDLTYIGAIDDDN
ncbi:hypothetical protein Tco_0779487, partial [Tanacetum coccineum]